MHRRPKLNEAIEVLITIANKYNNEDAASALDEYVEMKQLNEFLAARTVVDIVDHYYHVLDTKGIVHA